ncbi:hypothetical protein MNBD_ACTINO02-1458 [hydrothermal vent metagenome]|uniref:AB hydrolase-1 domain-containing protein n=1 Tax=hydrothermal vent metagenome TaxID=652676 RepID=A0A3B0SUQ9_9ZZZZ
MEFVDTERGRFAIRREGSGPTALFLHGFPLDATMWLDQITGLEGLGERIAMDLRGNGHSEPTHHDIADIDMHADDVVAVIEALGVLKVDLVGFSMGGYVALSIAQRYPERLRSLVLIDSKADADSDAAKANRTNAAVRATLQGREALAQEMIEVLLSPSASLLAKARLRTMVEACSFETIVASQAGMAKRPARTKTVAGLDVPFLAVVGEHDGVTPPELSIAMADAAPDGMSVVIPGAGHMAPIEKPRVVNDILRDWLKKVR